MNKSYENWLAYMHQQRAFYARGFKKSRTDDEFAWDLINSWSMKIGQAIWRLSCRIQRNPIPYTRRWFDQNSLLLWNTRMMLEDDLSRHLFDCHLVAALAGHQNYYYPRLDFDDFITIENEAALTADLPKFFTGLPLKIYQVRINNGKIEIPLSLITPGLYLQLLNRYRQYFLHNDRLNMMPAHGDVVLDCGACIGDTSLIFAALVGSSGHVHLFDPVPLHIKFCYSQASLNPGLSRVMHINCLAVSDGCGRFAGLKQDAKEISPAGLAVDTFETISIDEYAAKHNLKRVDYIKMDIEGSETAALKGARQVIREFKPKLAVSAYHKHDDLWRIPEIIKDLNPHYKVYFAHHSPMPMESIFYAL